MFLENVDRGGGAGAVVKKFSGLTEAKLQICLDQNKQGLQLFPRKHDQSLEIVKIAKYFITLTIFYLKL